jgi:hypothetical protein
MKQETARTKSRKRIPYTAFGFLNVLKNILSKVAYKLFVLYIYCLAPPTGIALPSRLHYGQAMTCNRF